MVRLNMSHGDHKSHKAVVDLVREYNRLDRGNLAIMLDTKGPEVRSGDIAEPIEMKAGERPCPWHLLLAVPTLSQQLPLGILPSFTEILRFQCIEISRCPGIRIWQSPYSQPAVASEDTSPAWQSDAWLP